MRKKVMLKCTMKSKIFLILLISVLLVSSSYAFSFNEFFSNIFQKKQTQPSYTIEPKKENTNLIPKKTVQVTTTSNNYKRVPIKSVSISKYSNYLKIFNLNDYGDVYSGSNSMHPTFESKDIVLEEKYTNQELKKGMIIRFVKNGKATVHRIISLNYINGKLIQVETQGDNNGFSEYVDIEDITHIVRGVIWNYE